jgi:hypothetical protein
MSAHLAILATAGLAALPLVGRSGSMAAAARGAVELPPPKPPASGIKPRWRSSWCKGKSWARHVASQYPIQWEPGLGMVALADKDRLILLENTLKQPNLDRLEVSLRSGGLAQHVRPHAIERLLHLSARSAEKLRERLTVDEEAFWTGVAAYAADVGDWMTSGDDPLELEALTDDIEGFLVKAWLKNKKKEGRS